jgi:hypothetical protein
MRVACVYLSVNMKEPQSFDGSETGRDEDAGLVDESGCWFLRETFAGCDRGFKMVGGG